MNSRERRVLASIREVERYLEEPGFDSPRFIMIREQLAQAIARIEQLAAEQHSAAFARRARALELRRLRDELRVGHLLRISRSGKLLLDGMPGIMDELRVPHVRRGDQRLLAASARILAAVRPHAAVFLEAKFAPDFVARAEHAAQALEQAATDPRHGLNPRAVATSELRRELRAARALILALDSEINAAFMGNREVLERWRGIRRVRPRTGRPRKSTRNESSISR
ncbi:MAG TPA: hypothetical protein VJU87_01105 [Gemmatimonadaceae bacterium]|nr:hypothetical protein [Gemmatimonadaceae bacterium]